MTGFDLAQGSHQTALLPLWPDVKHTHIHTAGLLRGSPKGAFPGRFGSSRQFAFLAAGHPSGGLRMLCLRSCDLE